MDCSPLGSSVHGISQTRTLEWVAISFSRGSSSLRNGIHVLFPALQVDFSPLSHQGSPKTYDIYDTMCGIQKLKQTSDYNLEEGYGNLLQYSYLENPHGQRSLASYSPWGHNEWDTPERLSIAHSRETVTKWKETHRGREQDNASGKKEWG